MCVRLTSSLKGGRPKKTSALTRGRPPNVTYTTVMQHIRHISSPTDTMHNTNVSLHTFHALYDQELTCKICMDRLTAPIELHPCQFLVCGECCYQWLAVSKSFNCPGCYGDHLHDLNTVRPASRVIHTLLQEIQERENGSAGISEFSAIATVMKAPVNAPLTSLEEKLLTNLVRRSMSQSTENVLRVKTGGQVSIM